MKSPFPGMDPYLESRWGDVHSRLAFLASMQLGPQLPTGLKARIEEEYVIESDDEERPKRIVPDTGILEVSDQHRRLSSTDGGLAVMEPLVVEWEVEPTIQRSVRIVDAKQGNRLVSAIEFLSSTNKATSAGRRAYRRKQKNDLDAEASLIEIDLIRVGSYVLNAPESIVPNEYRHPFRLCVTRGWEIGRAELYKLPLANRLPTMRVPLRESDPDIRLDLQKLIEVAYESGSYDDINYTRDPDPPLTGDDANWADQLLREQGKR